MNDKYRKTLDKVGETGAVLTDLSKAFDCIDQNLLIAKLAAYEFEKQSIDFSLSYLTQCKQKRKVNSPYRSWETLLSGVPQSSILGPILFNIYISAIGFLKRQKRLIAEVLGNLHRALEQLFQWFSANHLVGNAGNCHLLTSSKITNNIAISNTNVSSE